MIRPVHESQGQSRHPDWQSVYNELPIEELPWFSAILDNDIHRAMEKWARPGTKLWDVGCGEGSQADQFRKLGYDVLGTDISLSAIDLANERFGEEESLRFAVDDIIASQVSEKFDVVIDRGCFHVLAGPDLEKYRRAVVGALSPGGILIVKVFLKGEEQDSGIGPYRYSQEKLTQILEEGAQLSLVEAIAGTYSGPRSSKPLSLTATFERMPS